MQGVVGFFITHFTVNLARYLPVKKNSKSVMLDRIMPRVCGLTFLPTMYMRIWLLTQCKPVIMSPDGVCNFTGFTVAAALPNFDV